MEEDQWHRSAAEPIEDRYGLTFSDPEGCRYCGERWPCPWEQRRREVEWLRLQRNAWRPVIEAARKVVDSKGWAVMHMEAMDELENLLWELGDWEEYHQDQGEQVS